MSQRRRTKLYLLGVVIDTVTMGARCVHRQSKCPFLLLITILLTLLDLAGANLARALKVRLEPTQVSDLKAGRNRTVHLAILIDRDNIPLPEHPDIETKTWAVRVNIDSMDIGTAELDDEDGGGKSGMVLPITSLSKINVSQTAQMGSNSSAELIIGNLVAQQNYTKKDKDTLYVAATSFVVHGNFIGKTVLKLRIILVNKVTNAAILPIDIDGSPFSLYDYTVWVLRGSRTLNAIFVSTLGCLIILANVLMGCNMNLDVVWKVIKTPVAPGIGFVCQFLVMPLLAYALAHIFLVPAGMYSLALGLYTSGCVPGGGASNFWTVLLDGNSDLSITMTFLSTVAALLMMPFWMMLLGHHFMQSDGAETIHIPYKHICVSLLCLVAPLIVGLGIRRWLPKVAVWGRKILRPFLIFIIIFIVVFGSYANLYMFHFMNWRVLTSGLLLPWCGFMFGCFCAMLFRQPPANVAAIAIETGIQNSGVAIMLLKVSFSQPDADMSSVIPVVVSIFTPVPLLIGWATHKVIRRLKGVKESPDVEEKKAMNNNHEAENGVEEVKEKVHDIALIEQEGKVDIEEMIEC